MNKKLKNNILKKGSFEERIYNLYDNATTSEIAKEVGKSVEYTGSIISRLGRKGLIKTIKRNNKKIHQKLKVFS